MVAPTSFDITLPSSWSVPSAFWEMLTRLDTTRPSTIFYRLLLNWASWWFCEWRSLKCRMDWRSVGESRLAHIYHTMPMPFPCHAVPLRVQIVSHPFDLHSAAVFDSHMPCRARAMPRPCLSESDFSRPRHSAAWAWHGMCDLASTVQRRHVGDLPAFVFFRLPRGVPRRLLSETCQSVKL
jgi:hypothetical protein